MEKLGISVPTPRTEGITLTVRSANPAAPATLTRGAGGNLFTVPSGARLVLQNVVIDGGGSGNFDDGCEDDYEGEDNFIGNGCGNDDDDDGGGFAGGGGGSLVRINIGGTLTVNDGAVLRNNNITGITGGGVHVRGAFTMNGGRISDNITTTTGGGVYMTGAGSIFTMTGGEISGNSGSSGGGLRNNSGTFTMTGGVITGNTAATGTGGGVSGVSTLTVNFGGTAVISNNTAATTGGGIHIPSGGTLTVSGGKISDNTANSGGGVYISSSTFAMSGGEISGNITGANGGGVGAAGGTFVMTGGEISGNTGTSGGGVRISGGCEFTITNGKINANTANTEGGGVSVSGAGTTFTMSGGEISGNNGSSGGGVRLNSNGAFAVGGTAVITGNTVNDAANNVFLANNQYITLNTPAAGMNVGITKAANNNNGIFVQSGATAGDVQYFNDDAAVRTTGFYDGALTIGLPFYYQVVLYATATTDVVIEVGQDLLLDRLVSIPANADGKTLTIRSADPAAPVTLKRGVSGELFTVVSRAALILEDIIIDGDRSGNFGTGGGTLVRVNADAALTVNNGVILRNNVSTGNGGGVRLFSGGRFTMAGGEISGNTGVGGGGVVADGAFTMTGGVISGNTATDNSGGVRVSANGTFAMTNGEISGNTVPTNTGGGVFVNASGIFTMNNGEISGNTATSGNGVRRAGGTASINGGVVAGTGANVTAVVSGTHSLNGNGGDGVIIIWNKPEGDGPFIYTPGTSDALTVLPNVDATAVWAVEDGALGISYNHGDNTGFIPTGTMFTVSILSPDRIIPQSGGDDGIAVVAPVNALTAKFTAGPNPVSRSFGIVNFFWQGRWVDNAVLTIFDAQGNAVNRIKIADDNRRGDRPRSPAPAASDQSRRPVGSWDLTDMRGRLVGEGTYLVRGVITTSDGRRERVSVLIGVR